MKLSKFILVAFFVLALTSCSHDNEPLPFTLSNDNLAGTYSVNTIDIEEIESATSAAGVTVELSKNEKTGDTFQVDFLINSNGTYVVTGEYRSTSTVTPTPDKGQASPKIIILNASGTYAINALENSINFSQSNGNFINGVFKTLIFNETGVSINQDVTNTQGGISNNIKTAISLKRK
ncbi:hypothetical protein OD91_1766 [Lutibacter sp. Hel_I_33_5]|uniref:hypothetical protein n=1 Tax=Lutibacter sp. Hel_I_33_5 TaxID=1566289 RepID=UPI0011A83B20|nr:hypothetical protein [Lutibacter sp. Hel_I_33_5]TVZ56481.1 hypothetical protein OD91_1766 [Lutibacter sp. Hel_I_33_5]